MNITVITQGGKTHTAYSLSKQNRGQRLTVCRAETVIKLWLSELSPSFTQHQVYHWLVLANCERHALVYRCQIYAQIN